MSVLLKREDTHGNEINIWCYDTMYGEQTSLETHSRGYSNWSVISALLISGATAVSEEGLISEREDALHLWELAEVDPASRGASLHSASSGRPPSVYMGAAEIRGQSVIYL